MGINELLKLSMGTGDSAHKAAQEVMSQLNLDKTNWLYFQSLYKQKINPTKLKIKIGENAFPTAIAPKSLLKELHVTQYKDLKAKRKELERISKNITLWLKKTHGGGGTSVLREKYLQKIKHNDHPKGGSKGTDLFITVKGQLISLAEVQLLQALYDIQNKKYAEVFLHNIVSSESKFALEELWDKKSLLDSEKTYRELTHIIKGFYYFGETYQSTLPTLDESGQFSLSRMAPGGHAFFAVDSLLSALEKERRPTTKSPLIAVIGNGEDVGSTPDEIIFGHVYKNKIPIAMITTEKTQNDLKGGQIALIKEVNETFVTLIEQAQAKDMGQLDLFAQLGLEIKNDNQQALFNTNVAIFNYEVLVPKLEALFKKVGLDRFIEIITPTLIENKKKQKESDGVERTYEQLEGAMGSTLLNLDRHYRKLFHEPLVHFVNIEKESRTRFFSPIKSAFDFFMLFHSDRFLFDEKTFRLSDQKPGELPAIQLQSSFYNEVENVLESFSGAKLKNLKSLEVKGYPVTLKNVELSGTVAISNKKGKIVDLSPLKTIKNKTLEA